MTGTMDLFEYAARQSAPKPQPEVKDMPLALPVSPLPGESINSLMARATAHNVLDSMSVMLTGGSKGAIYAAGLATQAGAMAAPIARRMCGDDPNTIEAVMSLFHPAVTDRDAGWIDFHGVPLRGGYREPKRRRVVPGTLAKDPIPYCRTIWQVRAFPFDPRTREAVIDACPECKQLLGWTKSFGVHLCERCATEDKDIGEMHCVDLRNYPQPILPCEDTESLAFVADLIDPDPQHREAARRRLAQVFQEIPNADLFELVVNLAFADTTPPDRDKLVRERESSKFDRFTPDVLAGAGRVLTDWPNAFHELCDRSRAHAEHRTERSFGTRKELGPILFILWQEALSGQVKAILEKAIAADMKRTPARLRWRAVPGTPAAKAGSQKTTPGANMASDGRD
jgi:hypothetical protein